MKRSIAAAALLLGGALSACGSSSFDAAQSGSPAGAGGNIAGSACAIGNPNAQDGGGASLKVGSKEFAEEKLLATMTKKVLEKHNFKIEFTTVAADPAIDQALRGGTIDMLWQYTGTELQQFLGVDKPPTDLEQAFALVQSKDAAATPPLCWVAPAPFNDTNGIAYRPEDEGRFGTTLTSFSNYLKDHTDVKICIQSEFRTRADGIPGLDQAYGNWKDYPGLSDQTGTAEKAIAAKSCDAGEVFTTDSAIGAKHLKVFEDDRKVFPPDNVGLIVRAEQLQKYPAIANLMAPVARKLTTAVMIDLNKQVEIDGQSVDAVAEKFLQQGGFLG